jgi:SAM-dependent methyltransferase
MMIPNTIQNILLDIDARLPELNAVQIQQSFRKIPLDIFGRIQIDRPEVYPNLMRWLPEMPSVEVQESWTGSNGHALMTHSLSFVKTLTSAYHEMGGRALESSNVLDFGCGWGRMLRLFAKYVPSHSLFGVDPWDQSIEICRQSGIHANLAISDYLPERLPTPEGTKFDLIFAFSVFTHLSERATKKCAQTLKKYMSEDGVLVITIRPIEYWEFWRKHILANPNDSEAKLLAEQHRKSGFAFSPHNREKIDGDITYGDTSMSLDYIAENFVGLTVQRIELNELDSMQLLVFLTKS